MSAYFNNNTFTPGNDLINAFYSLNIASYTLAFLLHSTGFAALYLFKKRTNQNIILFQLSVVETLLIVFGIIVRTHEEIKMFLPYNVYIAMKSIEEMSVILLVFAMYIITVDRLVCVINPLKYKSRVTRKKLFISIIITSFIALLMTIMYKVLDDDRSSNIFVIYILIFLGVVYLLLAISTYSFVLYTVRKSNEQFRTNVNADGTSYSKQFLVPGIIVLTYVLFYNIPFVIQELSLYPGAFDETEVEFIRRFIGQKVCLSLQLLGLVLDPLTYIFMTKHYRDIIWLHIVRRCFACKEKLEINVANHESETSRC